MRAHLFRLIVFAISAALLGCEHETPSHPDLSGVWIGPATTLEPPAPMTPAGQALFDAARPLYGPRSVPVADSNDPVITCDPQGFPRILLLRSPLSGLEFVQTRDRMFQFFRYQRVYREIWTDGRPLPIDIGGESPKSPEPRLYGHSIGKWSDDGVFVVQTIGAVETWGDEEGHPHSLAGHIEERYRLIDQDSLELVVTVHDKEMYEKPFVASRQVLKRGTDLGEQQCVPSVASQYLELIAKPAAGRK